MEIYWAYFLVGFCSAVGRAFAMNSNDYGAAETIGQIVAAFFLWPLTCLVCAFIHLYKDD